MKMFKKSSGRPRHMDRAPRRVLSVKVYDDDGIVGQRLARFVLDGDTWYLEDELVFDFFANVYPQVAVPIKGVSVGKVPQRPLDQGRKYVPPGHTLVFYPGDITLDTWAMEIHDRLSA